MHTPTPTTHAHSAILSPPPPDRTQVFGPAGSGTNLPPVPPQYQKLFFLRSILHGLEPDERLIFTDLDVLPVGAYSQLPVEHEITWMEQMVWALHPWRRKRIFGDKPIVNSGFVLLVNTPKVRSFVDDWIATSENMWRTNQTFGGELDQRPANNLMRDPSKAYDWGTFNRSVAVLLHADGGHRAYLDPSRTLALHPDTAGGHKNEKVQMLKAAVAQLNGGSIVQDLDACSKRSQPQGLRKRKKPAAPRPPQGVQGVAVVRTPPGVRSQAEPNNP